MRSLPIPDPVRAVNVDGSFPPPTISKWLRHEAVNTDFLVAELSYWARRMAGGADGG